MIGTTYPPPAAPPGSGPAPRATGSGIRSRVGAVVTAVALIQLTKVVVAMVEDRHRRRDRRDDDEERQ